MRRLIALILFMSAAFASSEKISTQSYAQAIKEATFFQVDVYQVTLKGREKPKTATDIIYKIRPITFELKFLMAIKKDKLIKSWIKDLESSCLKNCSAIITSARKLLARLEDVKKLQRMSYILNKDKVDIYFEGRKLGTLKEQGADSAIAAAFVGNNAPEDLREKLLEQLKKENGVGD